MPPAPTRFFEDFVPGATGEYGPVVMHEAEILEFAGRYDPQYIHVDPEAAAEGPFGGLIASGWHTTAVMMRLLVDGYLAGAASIVSPGIDELRWLRPVRPGDALRVRTEVMEATPSRSRPDRGLVRTAMTVVNQNDEAVMTLRAMNLFRCRQAATG